MDKIACTGVHGRVEPSLPPGHSRPNMNTPWNEIAAAGTWTAMSGQTVPLSEADLDRIVAGFRPDDPDGAPLVFGHPSIDAPAYGWVAGLRREGGRLLAAFRDVPETVKDLVAAGRYRNVSVKLSPDKGRLVHVGLLGAVPPAITGLSPVKFSADDDGLTIEFSGGNGSMDEITQLKAQIARLQAEAAGGADKARIKELETELAKTKEDLAKATGKATETEQAFAGYRAAEADKAREARFAALVAADKILPGEKPKVLEFAKALAASAGDIEFAAPDGQTATVSKEEAYWRDLEARSPQGLLHEFAAPGAPGTSGQSQAAGKIPADLAKHV